MLIPLVSCSGGGGGASDAAGGTTGTLSIGLTDAPGDYQNVWVTIKEVLVHQAAGEVGDEDAGWISVLSFPTGEVIDLTTLEDGQIMDLGVAELEAGQYNQMRLILAEDAVAPHFFANYVVIEGAEAEEYVIGEEGEYYTIEKLKVPSGLQTGVKIVKGFEIIADGATALILDFDAQKSVIQAGKSGQWLLKPTIKVLETVNNSVIGTVDPAGASVSAQKYDENGDLAEHVTVVNRSDSDEDGFYKIYVAPEIYNIVATMTNYVPGCQEVEATPGYFNYPANPFVLDAANLTGTLTASVTGMADPEDSATFSIRQVDGTCGIIEVASVNVKNEESSDLILPEGITYQVVVSAVGEETYEESVALANGIGDIVVFPPPPAP